MTLVSEIILQKNTKNIIALTGLCHKTFCDLNKLACLSEQIIFILVSSLRTRFNIAPLDDVMNFNRVI